MDDIRFLTSIFVVLIRDSNLSRLAFTLFLLEDDI
jgi:hypothetical protein